MNGQDRPRTLDRRLRERLLDALMRLVNVIDQLDRRGRLANGERPVVIVAHNAGRMVRGTELGRQLEAIEREVETVYGGEPLMPELRAVPEALIFGGPGARPAWRA